MPTLGLPPLPYMIHAYLKTEVKYIMHQNVKYVRINLNKIYARYVH